MVFKLLDSFRNCFFTEYFMCFEYFGLTSPLVFPTVYLYDEFNKWEVHLEIIFALTLHLINVYGDSSFDRFSNRQQFLH